MNIAQIAIVAHVDRLAMAEHLANQTRAAYLTVDDGTLGATRNHLRAWTWHHNNTHTPWAVVLEDDAQPIPNFTAQLEQALTEAPAPIVCAYLGNPQHWNHAYPDRAKALRTAGQTANQTGACWLTTNDLLHGVAVAIHTDLLHDMLTRIHPATAIDYAIRNWARNTQRTIAFTWPSLVDHHDGPTLIHGRPGTRRQRKAWRTGTHTHWTNKAVTIA